MDEQKAFKVFGQVLRDFRHKKGVSQETLADEAGLDRTFISRLERGLTQPSLTTLLALAEALEVPAHSLIRELEADL